MSKKKHQHIEVNPAELDAIVERTREGALGEDDFTKLKAAVATVIFLTGELQAKGTTIARLRKMLFGANTEKTRDVLKGARAKRGGKKTGSKAQRKAPGHGRNGAAAYTGANREKVAHPSLHGGETCGGCLKGKVYLSEPKVMVRVTGMAPLSATVWECDRLRCNLCGEIFTAKAPAEVGEDKYDESAVGMTALLKYGTGLPFHRIEKLQAGMGIPLPAATQWQLVSGGAKKLESAFDELVNQAAQAEVIHNDDTTMKVLALTKEQVEAAAAGAPLDRTGVNTTGILAVKDNHPIALFFTGRQHAGENLADVLKHRSAELDAPIQMCDALAANVAGDFKTIVANCLSHARRGFVDVAVQFPVECTYVLEALGEVYRVDAVARKRQLSAADRLKLHQTESGPVMKSLEAWLTEQMEQKRVEPNSGAGQAIAYIRKHWSKLTLFLRKEGAPLDNNICERALKKVILHRKNALFYKTLNGAHVGDVFMSLIHTVELAGGNPFDYLVALLRHHEAMTEAPGDWMPWNYKKALAAVALNS